MSLISLPSNFRNLSSSDVTSIAYIPNRMHQLKTYEEIHKIEEQLGNINLSLSKYRPTFCQLICDIFTLKFFKYRKLRRTLPTVIEAVNEFAKILKNIPVAPSNNTAKPPVITPLNPPAQPTRASTPVGKISELMLKKKKLVDSAYEFLNSIKTSQLPAYYTNNSGDIQVGKSYTDIEKSEAMKLLREASEKLGQGIYTPIPACYHATGSKPWPQKGIVAAKSLQEEIVPSSELDIMESIIAQKKVQTSHAVRGLGAYASNNDEYYNNFGPLTFGFDWDAIQYRNATYWPKARKFKKNPSDVYDTLWIRVRMEVSVTSRTVAFIVAPDPSENSAINVTTARERIEQISNHKDKTGKNFHKYTVISRRVANIIRFSLDSVNSKIDLPGKDDMDVDLWRRDKLEDLQNNKNPDLNEDPNLEMPENMKHNLTPFEDEPWAKTITEQNHQEKMNKVLTAKGVGQDGDGTNYK